MTSPSWIDRPLSHSNSLICVLCAPYALHVLTRELEQGDDLAPAERISRLERELSYLRRDCASRDIRPSRNPG